MKRVLGIAAFGYSLAGAEGKSWTPARETLGVMPILGQSPMPTEAPRVAEGALLERATYQSTCGYVDGDPDYPLYCASSARCVFAYGNSYIGCCAHTATDCPVWTTCYAMTQSARFTTNNGLTLWCGQSSYPNCVRHVFQGSSYSGSVLWGCAVAKGTDAVYYDPTYAPTATTISVATKNIIRPGPTTTNANDEGGSGFPVAPVVGGAVGGVAVIGLIGLGTFLLIRSRRKKRNNAANPLPNASGPMRGQDPPLGPPGGGYNPSSPPMAQHGGYAPGVAGFAPVNPRDSIGKPPFRQPGFDNASMPGSPTSTTQSTLTPPIGYGHPTPPPIGHYPNRPQDYQAAQQQAFYNSTPPQGYHNPSQQLGYQQVAYNQPHSNVPQGQPQSRYDFAAELPVTRSDGEVRELSG